MGTACYSKSTCTVNSATVSASSSTVYQPRAPSVVLPSENKICRFPT